MSRAVAVIGSGQTKHGNRKDVAYPELVKEAVAAAFEDTGLSPNDIDGVVSGTMPSMMEGIAMTHFYLGDAMAAAGKPILKTETCGSTGISIAHTAFYWVCSGEADIILAVGHEKMHEGESQAVMSSCFDPFYTKYFTSGAPGIFSMQCQDWASRYNIPEEKVRDAAALISLINRENAFDNPYAHIKKKVTLEDIKKSPVISYPVRLLDVCPNSDGACAVIFASEEKAKKICKNPAWVKGVAYRGEEYNFGDGDKVNWQSAIQCAQQAYKQAGIHNPRKELDVVEIYNPFTFQELLFFECFGFSEPGRACDDVIDGLYNKDGELPCDRSGGVLCTNPIGAAGLIRVAEASKQVMGKAEACQVEGAKLALSHAMGGVMQFNGLMVIGSER
jgi:acetyl-CoA C-acetyltransferase